MKSCCSCAAAPCAWAGPSLGPRAVPLPSAVAPRRRLPRKRLGCSAPVAAQGGADDAGGGGGGGAAADGGRWHAPVVEALSACASQQGVAGFHFPGHGRGHGVQGGSNALAQLLGPPAFAHDLPELPELDNLFHPHGPIAEAQAMAARLFGAHASYFLVNGSTCGIHAAVMATCASSPSSPRTLVLPRNCHMCATSAMVLSGSRPAYIMPAYLPLWDIAHAISPHHLSRILAHLTPQEEIGAVLITSPTYHGICSDVTSIAHICHSYGLPLIVDEAHGAHFCFHQDLPSSALQQGADIVVQSTHKVLTSLTQSAMLHVQGHRVDKPLLAKCLHALQSSSPSYLLLSSLDASRQQASDHGRAAFATALQHAQEARRELSRIPGLEVLDSASIAAQQQQQQHAAAVAIDPLRITVGLWGLGLSGFEVDDKLRIEHGVVAELPSPRSITFAINLGTTSSDIANLVGAFRSIARSNSRTSESQSKHPVSLLPAFSSSSSGALPREAFFSPSERVKTVHSCGKVCCELICPYPPGIPVLVPGERITQGAIDYIGAVLEEGGFITGASDASMETVLVMTSE